MKTSHPLRPTKACDLQLFVISLSVCIDSRSLPKVIPKSGWLLDRRLWDFAMATRDLTRRFAELRVLKHGVEDAGGSLETKRPGDSFSESGLLDVRNMLPSELSMREQILLAPFLVFIGVSSSSELSCQLILILSAYVSCSEITFFLRAVRTRVAPVASTTLATCMGVFLCP